MNAGRWHQVERLYHAALARPATERAGFLADASAGDEEPRREVAQLLDAPPTAQGVFASPAAGSRCIRCRSASAPEMVSPRFREHD
jgi:hypothetical protein